QKYDVLFKHATEAMIIIQKGIIVRINSPLLQLVGYSSEEVIGTLFIRYVHPDDFTKVKAISNIRIAGNNTPFIYRIRIKRKDKSFISVEIKAGMILYREQPADFALVNRA
ncbi:MAG: PAS domain-containing protein, partial [Candidatus Aminicenantes bacterium]|nr:PAS domain-containing protein [Candidatus Aminicenantes bacterium]